MDEVTKAVREVSKAVFGSAGRLDAMAAVAVLPKPFLASEFAEEAGLSQSVAHQELARLRAVGLLTREQRSDGDRTYLYMPASRESNLWVLAHALQREQRKKALRRVTEGTVAELTEIARALAG